MSTPLTISKDDLREQENFNYSAIDQYWEAKGYTEDSLKSQYKILLIVAFLNLFCGLALYLAAWLSRKKISASKLLGDKSMTRWEKFCHEFKLGQAPAINFVSSCLITNDRVFITLRVVLAIWSLVVTIYTWAGSRSIFFGSYYPLATIITIYVSRQRHLIVEGFGSKMQFLNKLLQWLFSLQCPFRMFMAVMHWTKWGGTCRYRDMMKSIDLQRSMLFQSEFCPMIFLLTEMLWFDTIFDLQSCLHSIPLIAALSLQFIRNAFKENGGSAEPQLLVHAKEGPAASVPQFWMCLFVYPLCGLPLVLFYRTKMWIYSKTPVIKDRLQIRTQCVEVFKRRQKLNSFLTKERLEGRKSSTRGTYSSIGRISMNRQTMMRKISSS